MKTILILAVSVLWVFSAKADDDYATIVTYLKENGQYIIYPEDVAKVRAFMKANGYHHVSEIPKGAVAAAQADDGYATIVTYLKENGQYIIYPEDVAKVESVYESKWLPPRFGDSQRCRRSSPSG